FFYGKLMNESDFQQEQNYQQPRPNVNDSDLGTFDPKERYSGVLMQQGSVQTDADFNEEQSMKDVSLEDGVVVEFESGDARSPFVTGDFWNVTTPPPERQDPPASNDSSSATTDTDPDRKP